MKLTPRFKLFFFLVVFTLYASGLVYYIFDRFIKVKGPFGEENSFLQLPSLHLHAILGLLFFFLFGYLYRSHVEPGWRDRKRRRRRSGVLFLILILLLCLSVPALYYLSNENMKSQIAWLHTYVGLLSPLIFFAHFYAS